ncbi:MAG: outer membrane lipoprotein-sorting protein [Gammaproteobacteria bacterium]|nr:outer membrane lipoprotein-sorting protein [Gammaproteobacteria bacterium]MDH5629835.1 outer membrane lipoprotein-sorting protein [Gammaproteobacteria bacterium]
MFNSGYMKKTVLMTLMIIFTGAMNVFAEENISAEELVKKASLSAYYGGNDGRTMARMKIVDANGREQLRQFTILRKDIEEGGEQRFLVVFSRPADVSGTVFMVHKKVTGDDDRWLYLPALDLVKRISAGDKRTSFVGAHYFYEDVSGRATTEDTHQIVGQDEKFYILEHKPKSAESVEFASYKTWIDKSNHLPMKIEYYDNNGKAYRLIEALKVEMVQNIPTVMDAKVTNLVDNSYTLMAFRKMQYDIGVPEDVFTERALRNPPAQWLKGQ